MIAIHDRAGSFSDRWLAECRLRRLPCIPVDIFSHDIGRTLRENNVLALLCHPPMHSKKTALVASSIIKSWEAAGMVVFPSFSDFWHFDDKIAQAYLFQALRIRAPETFVFLEEDAALEWLKSAKFPVVFKLRSGAGSVNVRLLNSSSEAIAETKRMFRGGYSASDSAVRDIRTKLRRHRAASDWRDVVARAPGTVRRMISMRRSLDRERGYVLLQEFIPGNVKDVRVTVIGSRAFAFERRVREGDFRASGSGNIHYVDEMIETKFVRAAFDLSRRLGTTCVAFDFVERPGEAEPELIEMCFGFKAEAVYACGGHWTPDLKWQPGHVWPQDAVLDDVLSRLRG